MTFHIFKIRAHDFPLCSHSFLYHTAYAWHALIFNNSNLEWLSTCSNLRVAHHLWIPHGPCRALRCQQPCSVEELKQWTADCVDAPRHAQTHLHHFIAPLPHLTHLTFDTEGGVGHYTAAANSGRMCIERGGSSMSPHWGVGKSFLLVPLPSTCLKEWLGAEGLTKNCQELWALQGTHPQTCYTAFIQTSALPICPYRANTQKSD